MPILAKTITAKPLPLLPQAKVALMLLMLKEENVSSKLKNTYTSILKILNFDLMLSIRLISTILTTNGKFIKIQITHGT